LLLCLAIAPGLVSASLPHDNYLFLVEKHRRLAADAAARPKSMCSGEFAASVRQQLQMQTTL
jgi:hypothetical protein